MAISVTTAFKDALKGPVDRSQLKVEVLFSGSTWTDITAFVEEMSGTQEELSQLSGGASANTLNLTLINDDGRFSPKNTASPYTGNLLPNKPIRVSSVYGSESVRLFTGYVSNWIPNAKSRNCQVTAEDAARILRRRDIVEETVFNPDAPTSGYYLTRVIERAAWLSGLRWDTCNTKTDTSGNVWAYSDHDGTAITVNKSGGAARATYTIGGALVMTLDLVDLLMPVAPLKGKALAVLDQLAKVVDGAVYFDAQGQLVFRSRMYRNDSTLSSVETLTVSSLEDVTAQTNFEDSRWAQIVNRATVRSTPYTFRTDASGNVLEEEIPFKGDLFGKYYFAASEEYPAGSDADLYCEIPNGIKLFKTASYPTAANLVLRSVDNADPTKETNSIKFKSGFPVFEQTRIKVAFENTGASAERIQMLTFRGKLMRPVQKCQSIQRNEASIALYDQRDKEVSNDLIPNAGSCKNLAAWLVEDGRNPKTVLTLPVMHGIPWLELGDKITVSETITNTVPVSEDFIVRRISWRWSLAAFAFTIEACSPAANFTVSSLPVAVVNVETSNQNNNGQEADQISIPAIDFSGAQIGLNNIPSFQNVLNAYRSFTFTGMHSKDICMGPSIGTENASLWTVGEDKVCKVDPYTATGLANATFTDGGSLIQFYNCHFVSSGSNHYLWAIGVGPSGFAVYLIAKDLATCTKKYQFASGEEVRGLVFADGKVWATFRHTSDFIDFGVKVAVFDDLTTAAETPTVYTIASPADSMDVGRPSYDGTGHLYFGYGAPSKIVRMAVSDGSFTAMDAAGYSDTILITPGYIWTYQYPNLVRYVLTPNGISPTKSTLANVGAGVALSYTGGYIVSVGNDQKLIQVNPLTGSVVGTYQTNSLEQNHAFDGEAIWIATQSDRLTRIRLLDAR